MNFIVKGAITIAIGVIALVAFQILRIQNFDAANLYEHTGIDPSVSVAAIMFLIAGYFLASGFMKASTGRNLKYLRLWWLILQDFRIRSFRNLTMTAGIAVVIGILFLSLTLTIGAVRSTDVAIGKAGADIIVVPQGTVPQSDLYSYPFSFSSFVDRSVGERIAALSGVESVSSQAYMGTVKSGGGCGSLSSYFFIAVDSDDSFVMAWLDDKQPLKKGEVVAGSNLGTALDTMLLLFDWKLEKKASIPLTGTYVDNLVYMSTETAEELIRNSTSGERTFVMPITFDRSRFTTFYVKVNEGASIEEVADNISKEIKDVTVIETNELGFSAAKRLSSLLTSFTYIGSLTVGVSVVLVSSLSSVTVNEKRREIGVLRSMGASKNFISKLLASQIVLLAVVGGIAGIAGASLALYFNYAAIISSLKIPFIAPGYFDVVWVISISLIIAVATGAVAALYPAYKASRIDPYEAIRRESR